jgi:hypothetical protein
VALYWLHHEGGCVIMDGQSTRIQNIRGRDEPSGITSVIRPWSI